MTSVPAAPRKARTTRTVASRTKTASVAVDRLADQLATTLTMSNVKGKQKETPLLSPAEKKIQAMRMVNSASQRLSTIIQTGWKKSQEKSSKKSPTLTDAEESFNATAKNLSILRELNSGDLDIERAGISILGKLVTLEMYDSGLRALAETWPRICAIYGSSVEENVTKKPHSDQLHLLSLPIPNTDIPNDPIVLTLISTYLINAITILSHTHFTPPSQLLSKRDNKPSDPFATFCNVLYEAPTLLSWKIHYTVLPSKHLDSIFTKAYSVLTKLTASVSSSTPSQPINPGTLFRIRTYALRCLACTSNGTINDPDTFWTQVTKVTSAYVKGQPSTLSSQAEEEATNLVLTSYNEFVALAEQRADVENFMSGSGFVGFCEAWITFANRAGDVQALDKIGTLTRIGSIPSSSSVSDTSPFERSPSPTKEKYTRGKDVLRSVTTLCAGLAQVTTILEKMDWSDENVIRIRDTSSALKDSPALAILSQPTAGSDKEAERIAGKLSRAVDRARRASVKLVDSSPTSSASLPDGVREAVYLLLNTITSTLEVVIQSNPDSNFITQSLDVLFVLSRTTVSITDPRTYNPAYEYLTRAAVLCDVEGSKLNDSNSTTASTSPSTSSCVTTKDKANFIRCTSGAFHNLGGTLYTNGRFGSAIPFLREGCRLGSKALEVWRGIDEKDGVSEKNQGDGKVDPWKQLEEQIWRRWQLLGVCYIKTGDRRPAYEAFQESIKDFPYAGSGFITHSDKNGFSGLFLISSGVKELASVLDRLTYLGTCELLLPPESISLASLGTEIENPTVLGALLERQIDVLENNRRKDDIKKVLGVLMQDAVEVYRKADMPIRTARMFLRCLALGYHVGPECLEENGLGTPMQIGGEVDRLLDGKNFGRDQDLASFCPEYKASIHLWLGLHAHRRSDSEQVKLLGQHVDAACQILRSIVSPRPGSPKASRKSLPKSSPTSRKVATLASRSLKSSSLKSRAKARAPPVTPKGKSRNALQDIPINAPAAVGPSSTDSKQPTQILDGVEKLADLLQLTSNVLGLFALTLSKINILDILRRLSDRYLGATSDACILSSSELAHEYVLLGKIKRANKIFNQTYSTVQNGGVSDEASCTFFLQFAEASILNDNVAQSLKLYTEGQTLSSRLSEDKDGSSLQRVYSRIVRIEKVAMAHQVVGLIQVSKDDSSASLQGLLQSLRLWNRAFESLSKLHAPLAPKSSEDSNPFEVSSLRNALPTETPQPLQDQTKKVYTRRSSMNHLEWRISRHLLESMFALSQAYLRRGSPREAQYFIEQARDLAEALNASALICRALARNGELQMLQGKLEAGLEEVVQLDQMLEGVSGTDVADIYRVRGDLEQKGALMEDADQHYEAALKILEEFDQTFGKLDGIEFGPRHSAGVNSVLDVTLPELLAQVLHQHIWLLRDENNERYNELLNRFLALPSNSITQNLKDGLMAKLTLHDVHSRSRVDMFLSSIGETTIAMPMGTSNNLKASLSPSTQEIVKTLENAEKLFWTHLDYAGQRGRVPDIRKCIVSVGLIRALQTSLGRSELVSPALTSGLLDASSALTLRSEMLEAIQQKFSALGRDDLLWPSLATDGSPLPQPRKTGRGLMVNQEGSSSDEDEGLEIGSSSLKEYWNSVRQRYLSYKLNAASLLSSSTSTIAELPSNWTVVHITVSEDKNTLFISRQRGGGNSTTARDQPLIFCVPLKGRRDGPGDENDQHLTFEDAIVELDEIVRLSNETTKSAASIKDNSTARAKWWKERGALDTRMKELLENIEFCWLGAFKTILSKNPRLSPESINTLRIQFDRVFQRGLHLQDKKTKERAIGHKKIPSESINMPNRVTLDDSLVECFSALSPACRDEELEDLVYFMLDLYQFHGVPVAIAEIDIDQVVIDLRSVLDEHNSRFKSKGASNGHGRLGAFGYSGGQNDDEHLFLVLDKNVQGLPWENIPILRGRSVSRVPSTSFLLDRIHFARYARQAENQPKRGHSRATSRSGLLSRPIDRAVVNPRKGYYIMNPSGDLSKTEKRFEEWLNGMEEVGWKGIKGRPPSELEVLNALENEDLVVYFGHGGAEQYVRSHKIRSLPRCAAVMLWGCSSGALKDMGDFDRVGTPLNYMLAGCPTLVANLWDVTDRDIDMFSQAVFDKMHLDGDNISSKSTKSKSYIASIRDGLEDAPSMSLMNAVAESRDSCKLKYLTGAAPVVYGIPFYL
ncbi:hypothetical protein K435DRAFT_963900 [Dendrothele bispora CBS 962.96]|uniref:separase n=1 Tax=Dendrothele bispora (strain CBS 962.96) TaxID=1314807 RepID=A0A4V4HGZ2_DENBC|nr:hypothetical protein K435DRAFT_963900 [Dendrothele bispora CBS 962.96]